MFDPIKFTVVGKPVTQGSKNPVVPTYKDGRIVRRHRKGCAAYGDKTLAQQGRPAENGSGWVPFECKCPPMVNTIDDNEKALESWRTVVGLTARNAYKGPVLDELLVACFEFVQPRPKAHYGTGKNAGSLKDSAPAAPGKKPDGLKLARAVEDALSGVLYTDDSLIVSEIVTKRYCGRDEPYHVNVIIRPADVQTVGDMVAAGVLEVPTPEFEQLSLVA
jgi:Holliday junction resolvase RusA-like endonuclease